MNVSFYFDSQKLVPTNIKPSTVYKKVPQSSWYTCMFEQNKNYSTLHQHQKKSRCVCETLTMPPAATKPKKLFSAQRSKSRSQGHWPWCSAPINMQDVVAKRRPWLKFWSPFPKFRSLWPKFWLPSVEFSFANNKNYFFFINNENISRESKHWRCLERIAKRKWIDRVLTPK